MVNLVMQQLCPLSRASEIPITRDGYFQTLLDTRGCSYVLRLHGQRVGRAKTYAEIRAILADYMEA